MNFNKIDRDSSTFKSKCYGKPGKLKQSIINYKFSLFFRSFLDIFEYLIKIKNCNWSLGGVVDLNLQIFRIICIGAARFD